MRGYSLQVTGLRLLSWFKTSGKRLQASGLWFLPGFCQRAKGFWQKVIGESPISVGPTSVGLYLRGYRFKASGEGPLVLG